MSSINKLVLHPSFMQTLQEINKINLSLPIGPSQQEIKFGEYTFPPNGELVTQVEEMKKHKLNAERGDEIAKETISFAGYDESILKYTALEGVAYFTSHSLIIVEQKEYLPVNYLTFYFYTRSEKIVSKTKNISFTDNPERESKRDYLNDKIRFLEEHTPKKTMLFIDGPLIGGDLYTYMIQAIEKFLLKDIIPIFFIKNSESNLVTENINELKGKYNSDMHWSYSYLAKGQRTNLFSYRDKRNPKNAKIFCYLKALDLSPQRIEFHVDTYHRYKDLIPGIMDLIYYLILVQGDKKNPQLRPISIAEKYARTTLGMINIYQLMKESGLVPSMNQERFGG